MSIEAQELFEKFTRTGMVMRHIDADSRGKHHGHHHHHHHGHCCKEEAPKPEGQEAQAEGKENCKRRRMRHHGQARVLSVLALKEGINQKDLAYYLGIRPQSIGEMLQSLEERGMVERKKSETDGRAIEVTLTEEGRKRAAAIDEQRKLAAADIFAVLTDEEKEQLSAIVDKLAEELDKRVPHHRGGHKHEAE